jgi:hypothetical protein
MNNENAHNVLLIIAALDILGAEVALYTAIRRQSLSAVAIPLMITATACLALMIIAIVMTAGPLK